MLKAQRRRRGRPLLGLAAVAALRTLAPHVSGSLSFVGAPKYGPARQPARAAVGQTVEGAPPTQDVVQPQVAAVPPQAAAPQETEEMSDWDKLMDRFNTRGGLVVATLLVGFFFFALYKFFQFVCVDEIQAGLFTTTTSFIVLMGWTFTYFSRVANKSTTYAQQLADYEQSVMIRRIQEMTEEEIEALCAEVGISETELQDAVTDVGGDTKQTSKEKVLAIFRGAPTLQGTDPRMNMF